jgi:hypothetical protein
MVDFALRQDCLFLVSDASRNTHYYLFQIHHYRFEAKNAVRLL